MATGVTGFVPVGLLAAPTAAAATHTPFACDSTYYLMQPNSSDATKSVLGKVVFPSGSSQGQFAALSNAPFGFNAMGFNPSDNLIYGITVTPKDDHEQLFRVGAEGTFELLGEPVTAAGQPLDQFNANIGAFLSDGTFAVSNGGSRIIVMDVNQSPPRILTGPITSAPEITTADWAVNPIDNQAYTFDTVTKTIVQIDPRTGATKSAGGTNYDGGLPDAVGSVWMDGNGQLTFAESYKGPDGKADGNGQIHFFAAPYNSTTHLYTRIRHLGDQPSLGKSGDATNCAFTMDLEKAGHTTDQSRAPGGSVTTFDFTIVNGSGAAKTFDLHDTFPPYLTRGAVRFEGQGTPGTVNQGDAPGTLTITGNRLGAKETMVIHADVNVAPDAPKVDELNRATLTGTGLPAGGVVSHDPTTTAFDPGPTPVYLRPADKPDLMITKTADPTSVMQGSSVTYHLSVTDKAGFGAGAWSVQEAMPGGFTPTAASQDCSLAGGVVSWQGASFPKNGISNCTITAAVSTTAPPGPAVNTATLTADQDTDATNNVAQATVTVTKLPTVDLGITKSAPAEVNAGSEFDYTMTVVNNGDTAATGATITDQVPAGLTILSVSPGGSQNGQTVTWALGAVTPGTPVQVSVHVKAPNEPTGVDNTATVAVTGGGTPDNNPTNDFSSVHTEIKPLSDVSLLKTAPVSAQAGSPITYTLQAANYGPSTATNVVVHDPLPAGTTFVSAGNGGTLQGSEVQWTLGNLAPNAPVEPLTLVVTAPAEPTTVVNKADITTVTPEVTTDNNHSETSTTIQPVADLTIVKSGPQRVDANGQVTYTLLIGNNGPSTASDVRVDDPLPDRTVFVSADNGGALQNGTISWALGPLQVRQTKTLTVVVKAPAPPEPAVLTNEARVSGSAADPDMSNNQSHVDTTIDPTVDLVLTDQGPPFADAGTGFTWTLTVANKGPSTAHNVVVTDTVPAGFPVGAPSSGGTATPNADGTTTVTWTVGDLVANGPPVTLQVPVTAPPQAGNGHNAASVTGSVKELDDADNHAASDVPIRGFTLKKTVQGNGSARAGQRVTYTIVVTNPSTVPYDTGRGLASFTDDMSGVLDDATLDAVEPGGGTITNNDKGFSWQGPIGANASTTLTVTVLVKNPGAGGDHQLVNFVVGGTNCPPSTGPGDCGPKPVAIRGVQLDKVASSPVVHPGETITYTVEIRNNGGFAFTDADPAVVTDDLAKVLDDADFVTASADAGTVTPPAPGASVLTWTGALATDQVVHVTYSLLVRNPQAGDGSLDNAVGSIEDDDCLPTAPCGTHGGSTLVQAFVLNKSVDKTGGVAPGEEVTYTITVTNTGRVAYADGEATFTEDLTGILDDAELLPDKLAADVGTLDYQQDAKKIVWTGPLPVVYPATTAGATIVVTVRVLDPDLHGDHELVNTVIGGANCPLPSGDYGPECHGGDQLPISGLTAHKAADVQVARPGDVVTYTITVTNTGKVDFTDDNPAAFTDDLSKVLDDAEFTGDPEASAGTATFATPTLSWSSALVQGASATITYKVTVAKQGKGDHVLSNVVFAPGSNCVPTGDPDPACGSEGTVKVAELHVAKTANTKQVTVGDTVVYTVKVTNVGAVDYLATEPAADEVGVGPAMFTDDMSEVLDDATYKGDAHASAGTTHYEEPKLSWSGPVAVGATATVTYSVKVNDPASGDRKLTNAVIALDSNCPCSVSTKALPKPPAPQGGGGLAYTGAAVGGYLAAGAGLVLLGLVFLAVTRIRREGTTR
ncbi:DUF11 domain-containing protein [Labedaea rhizosphaerae]|uniref:DUF11 domain-containing protein n=1 Tax=Labedaea rhizosphaerae TaxID=598644 RepID=UPI001060F25D|nr:DUF11 domain-containing protein [Labedaea rhizosphaerae]